MSSLLFSADQFHIHSVHTRRVLKLGAFANQGLCLAGIHLKTSSQENWSLNLSLILLVFKTIEGKCLRHIYFAYFVGGYKSPNQNLYNIQNWKKTILAIHQFQTSLT